MLRRGREEGWRHSEEEEEEEEGDWIIVGSERGFYSVLHIKTI
jgi:hypothetical protein